MFLINHQAEAAPADAKKEEPAPDKETEMIIAERKMIEAENQKKLDEYQDLLKKGRENVKVFLAENLDLMVEIMEKVKEAAGIIEADGTEVDLDLGGVDGMTEADDAPISLE